MIRDAVSLVSCARNTVLGPLPTDHGALLRAPGSCALGGFIGIGWKGTRIPAYLAKYLCCFDAAERLWRSRESKIYRRYPSEIHLASALKSVTVVAIWLPEKNGLSEGSYKPLILRYVWFRELNLNLRPSGYETDAVASRH